MTVVAGADSVTSLPPSPRNHFRLRFYGAVDALRAEVAEGAADAFPFLRGYFAELDAAGAEGVRDAAADWEAAARLPIGRLRDVAALDDDALTLLFVAGLVEEDARFGVVFELLHGIPGCRRPTFGLLAAWLGGENGGARAALRRLLDAGLLRVRNADAPRAEQELEVAPLIWDALRGEVPERPAPWLRFRPQERLTPIAELILPPEVRCTVESLPALLAAGAARAVVVRGPRSGGRRTVAGAVAAELGCGLLEIDAAATPVAASWSSVGPLTTLLDAVPVVVVDPAPGEAAAIPELGPYTGPVLVVAGRHGGIAGAAADGVTVVLGVPGADERAAHWAATGARDGAALAEQRRMTGGNIRRVGPIAHAEAALAGRAETAPEDVRRASSSLSASELETLAHRLPQVDGWAELAVSEETAGELALLAARCRNRERLPIRLRGDGVGVRALFTGPSGTGKTLAARALGADLGLDVYRLDLAAVVNKYLGETEKNLAAVFARAEELDVVLLLDEGDALLTRRTDVHTSNDRYANLETNYLLQRLETFEGILVVTTNAGDRIDRAFQRRMDVVIEFRRPDAAERLDIWTLHLPPDNVVSASLLHDLAVRCDLTGGAIRNAALHAALLALEAVVAVGDNEIDAAVRREYRKLGAVCPLRQRPG